MVLFSIHMLRRKTGKPPAEAKKAWLVIQWLNRTRGKEVNRRIVKLLKIMTKLQGSIQTELPILDLLTWKPKGTREQMSNLRRTTRLANDLRGLLTSYTVHPELSATGKGKFYVRWRPTKNTATLLLNVSADGDTVSVGGGDVLLRILALAERGSLDRIRECAYCSAWFFRRVRHQAYCHTRCQQANFRTSPHFKAQRRVYMRQYRRDEIARDKKARELANSGARVRT
jgi:hypothetical protein